MSPKINVDNNTATRKRAYAVVGHIVHSTLAYTDDGRATSHIATKTPAVKNIHDKSAME